jgi:23S rRNA (pseudouridine1915-N3)-methyltransferase
VTILVLSVGRPDSTRFGPLFDDYAARIRRFGIKLDSRYVPEVKPGGHYSDAHVMEREAEALSGALPRRGTVIACAAEGRTANSESFARSLGAWAVPQATFVIGGPLGLAPAFRERADRVLSLSPMTLPHDLSRLVLVEQIFRAVTLLRGVPYHK